MGGYAELMDALRLRVRSADGRIQALRQRGSVGFSFSGGAYHGYAVTELEHQLAQLCRSLAEGHRKARLMALREASGEAVDDSELDGDVRRFRDRCRRIAQVGRSRRGFVQVATIGLEDWSVSIKDEALDRLAEDEFTAELSSAHETVHNEYSMACALVGRELDDNRIAPAAGTGRKYPR